MIIGFGLTLAVSISVTPVFLGKSCDWSNLSEATLRNIFINQIETIWTDITNKIISCKHFAIYWLLRLFQRRNIITIELYFYSCLFVRLSVFVYLSVRRSARPSVCASVRPPVCPITIWVQEYFYSLVCGRSVGGGGCLFVTKLFMVIKWCTCI